MSMYAYWLANTGLTVYKLTGLMTEGIGAEELYALQESQMKKIRVLDEKDVEKITQSRRHWEVQERWGKLQEEGIGFVCVEEARYPQKLRQILAAPYALYYIGRLPEETRKSVAIVGARTRSAYGSQITGKLARALAQNRMDIISGMAMGIDADAHSGALEENGDTYAVLGCGVDVCYPKRNRYLYEKMQDRGGILSEYPPGTPPLPGYFPQRNRIIAGLADYVIVMEARKKSGSLITADYAMEQGKEVYALPGRVTDALSEGTNHLIQQGAGIFVSVEDFLQELQLQPQNITTQIDFRKNLLEKDESLVYALLDFYPVGLGTLIEKSPYGLVEILPVLERLEQKGFIQETIPNYYIKTI